MCHRDDIPGRGWGSVAEQTPMLQPSRCQAQLGKAHSFNSLT